MLSIDLTGSRALVTGAGQGVGRQTAITLAEAGATVLVNDRIAERCEQVVGEITALGLAAEPAAFDVTRYDAIEAAVSAAGVVDVLVNNAGNAGAGSFQLKTVAEGAARRVGDLLEGEPRRRDALHTRRPAGDDRAPGRADHHDHLGRSPPR